MRVSNPLGVLLPVFSLPSEQGVGCFGAQTFAWIDSLNAVGITHWQVCPLGPTGYGYSPYQPLSEFALNPIFLDVCDLRDRGWLNDQDLNALRSLPNKTRVLYKAIQSALTPLLYQAYDRFLEDRTAVRIFKQFQQKEASWLEPYCLFCALKSRFQGAAWWQWPETFRSYTYPETQAYYKSHQSAVKFFAFVQWILAEQWAKIKAYARAKNVCIIGDIPIYVGEDSVAVWENRRLFQWDGAADRPLWVAGVPPDYFSPTGQLWGNPLYDWDHLKDQDYDWWIRRIRKNLEWFDWIRLDHFRGFYNYWAVPYGAQNACSGQWRSGPQTDFFDCLEKEFPQKPFILEDLGDLDSRVRIFQSTLDLPGMSVLQFAFEGEKNPYLPKNWNNKTVVYTGTHDNDTSYGWFQKANPDVQRNCLRVLKQYLGASHEDTLVYDLIQLAYRGVPAKLAVIPLQDWLKKDSKARINTPGTLQKNNWSWRCSKADFKRFEKAVERVKNTHN